VGEDETDAATFADLYTLPTGMAQRCGADSTMQQPVSPSRDAPAVGSPDAVEDLGRGHSAHGSGSALTTAAQGAPFMRSIRNPCPSLSLFDPRPSGSLLACRFSMRGGDGHSITLPGDQWSQAAVARSGRRLSPRTAEGVLWMSCSWRWPNIPILTIGAGG